MSPQSPAGSTRAGQPALDGKRRGRIIMGAVGLVFGAWFTWYTWANVPMGIAAQPGAGIFPLAVGVGLMIASVLVIVEAWRTDVVRGEVNFPTGGKRRTVLLMAVALIALVAFYRFLGQYVGASLFMVASLFLLGNRSWVRNVLYGIAIGVGISAFFVELLGVRLPMGLFGPTGLLGGVFW